MTPFPHFLTNHSHHQYSMIVLATISSRPKQSLHHLQHVQVHLLLPLHLLVPLQQTYLPASSQGSPIYYCSFRPYVGIPFIFIRIHHHRSNLISHVRLVDLCLVVANYLFEPFLLVGYYLATLPYLQHFFNIHSHL